MQTSLKHRNQHLRCVLTYVSMYDLLLSSREITYKLAHSLPEYSVI